MTRASKILDHVNAIAIVPLLFVVLIYGGIQEYFLTPRSARQLKEAGIRRGRLGN